MKFAITAPKLAPLDIPIIPLSTIGFFKRLCIVQPHNAKAPPTITATIILGNLTKKYYWNIAFLSYF